MEGNVFAIGVQHQIADSFHIFPVYVVDFNRQIKYFSSFVYLGNDFSGKSHIDKFRELG